MTTAERGPVLLTQNSSAGVAADTLDQPYQLKRRFLTVVLPLLASALVGLLFAVSTALSLSVERAYQAQAAALHTTLAATAEAADPSGWQSLKLGGPTSVLPRAAEAIVREAEELSLACAVIVDAGGSVIAGTVNRDCATFKRADLAKIVTGTPLFVEEPGPPLHWTVATRLPTGPGGGALFAVTSEPAAAKERLIGLDTLLWLVSLGTPLLGAIALGTVFVTRAQADIDGRTGALRDARASLARFVSDNTQRRARFGVSGARHLTATVLFLDIRDFSSFAEASSADEAAELVSRIATVAFSAIIDNEGDVDRLVGDGVIAWFEGDRRRENALKASAEILVSLRDMELPRGVGVGLHDGRLVEAEIGTGERKDATILGSTVNIASRLCGLAGPDEIIASIDVGDVVAGSMLEEINVAHFELKGHRHSVVARRLRLK